MGDMGDMFNDMKSHKKKKRRDNLAAADSTGWSKFTPYHWRKELLGFNLDYWPSTKRWCYRGKYGNGSVDKFIASRIGKVEKAVAQSGQEAHLERARSYRHQQI